VVDLLRAHGHDLGQFFTSDPKGRHVPDFLAQISAGWLAQQRSLLKELDSLRSNIDHIKEIVAMQQGYAKVSGATELVDVRALVEDSLRMNEGSLMRHQVQVVREFHEVPPISVEKHKSCKSWSTWCETPSTPATRSTAATSASFCGWRAATATCAFRSPTTAPASPRKT